MSNLFAIVLQALAIRLGTVSGLSLAEACRVFLPRWLNYALYALAEIAIIATDIAEVCCLSVLISSIFLQLLTRWSRLLARPSLSTSLSRRSRWWPGAPSPFWTL